MGTTDIHQLELTSLVKKPLSTPDKMRCFIVLALVAAASAIPLNWDPCVNGEFEIPEGAIEIDLKNPPADLPEGFTIVNDPSEIELPNGLTFEDLKNGDVPDDWEKKISMVRRSVRSSPRLLEEKRPSPQPLLIVTMLLSPRARASSPEPVAEPALPPRPPATERHGPGTRNGNQ